jgi:cyclin H
MAKISIEQKLWIISLNELSKKYDIANQRAMHALQMYGSSKVILQDDGSLGYPSDVVKEYRRQGPILEPLSINEELFLQRYYEGKVQEICAVFQFPHKIQATSIMFLKKFYQKWYVMEHNPKTILLVCICLACQVEDNFVSAQEFGRCQRVDPHILEGYRKC